MNPETLNEIKPEPAPAAETPATAPQETLAVAPEPGAVEPAAPVIVKPKHGIMPTGPKAVIVIAAAVFVLLAAVALYAYSKK